MTKYLSEAEAKGLVCNIGKKMYDKHFVAANDGNITVRIGDNAVVATPTGVSKGEMRPEMLLTVDLDGNILAGDYPPTSELRMHLGVYRENPKIQSTCHSHSLYLSAFAIAGMELDMAISPETSFICGRVPVAPYATPGTGELADSVKPYVKDFSIVLLSNHGPLSWGEKPETAWFVMEAAEAFAKECIIIKYVLQRSRPVSASQMDTLAKSLNHNMHTPRRTNTPDEITNLVPGVPITGVDVPPARLSDEDIERIADRVAAKLAGNK